MKSKCNSIIYILLLVLGIFTVFQYLQTDTVNLFTYATSVCFLWWFSVSDIKTRTISAQMANTAIVLIYLMRFCSLCILSAGKVPQFIVESLIVLFIKAFLSGIIHL